MLKRRKKMSEKPASIKLPLGTLFQRTTGGVFSYRYQINGQRKCVSLDTNDETVARKKVSELVPITQAKHVEIISAHVKYAKNMAKQKLDLPLKEAWNIYSTHPERATLATVSEQLCYASTFQEFVDFVHRKNKGHSLKLSDITVQHADEFARYLRTTQISVSTHNRKIKRIRKVFEVLKDYYEGENPFVVKILFRKEREEQGLVQRRQAFTPEQERAILEVLDNPIYQVINKAELRIVYYIGMYTGQRLKDCVLIPVEKMFIFSMFLSPCFVLNVADFNDCIAVFI